MIGRIIDEFIQKIVSLIWTTFGNFLVQMQGESIKIFELDWVQKTILLFFLFGGAMFIVGTILSIFDFAVEYQNGRASARTTAINILKGFFASSLFCVVPVELYRFSLTLQGALMGDLSVIYAEMQSWSNNTIFDFAGFSGGTGNLLTFIEIICGIIAIIKIFFASIKRGGILFIQIAIGSLYMISIPRGYTDGFYQWVKQIVAICLTSFLQTVMLFLGVITIRQNVLWGIGILIAAAEVPRIAQHFGLDSSVRIQMQSVLYSTNMAMNMIRNNRMSKVGQVAKAVSPGK